MAPKHVFADFRFSHKKNFKFEKTQKPFIFTYFKDVQISTGNNTPEVMSVLNFKQKVSDLGHFYSTYTDFNHLWNQFNKELERLAEGEFKEMVNTAVKENGFNEIQQNNIYGDNIGRDKIVGK